MKKLIAQLQRKRGFTVIEAFVGISILLIGIVGPLTLVNTNLQGARFSRDQVTAIYLAQEAIETVRQVRDSNFLAGNNWDSGLTGCTGGSRCTIDDGIEASHTESCEAGDTENVGDVYRLQVDRSSGEYGHNSSGDSRFWRCVEIDTSSSGDVRIIATVIFDTGSYRQAYETVGYMHDWYPSN